MDPFNSQSFGRLKYDLFSPQAFDLKGRTGPKKDENAKENKCLHTAFTQLFVASFSSKLFCRRTKNDAILLHLNRKSCGLDCHFHWDSAHIFNLINVFEFLLVSPEIGKTSAESVSFIIQQPLNIFSCHFNNSYSFLYANYEFQVIFEGYYANKATTGLSSPGVRSKNRE